jgi:GNAT superfamily N-acetyltransferase
VTEGYEIPEVPGLESALRGAFRAMEPLTGDSARFVGADHADLWDLGGQFEWMVRQAEGALAAELGPRISWSVECPEPGDWEIMTAVIDLDSERRVGDIVLDCSYGEDAWAGSCLDRAARAYRRDAGWDFPPGRAGIWLLALAPVEMAEEEGLLRYTGYLPAFVILHDRDHDGDYETVAHVWTARAWRRRGNASRLLREARHSAGAHAKYTPKNRMADGSDLGTLSAC